MGLRFRKTIKICKGVKVNVSKSGLSYTIGMPGMSINTGKRGTFANLGLPGTGISYRSRIGGGRKKAPARPGVQPTARLPRDIVITLDDAGDAAYALPSGEAITDAALIRRIRADSQYSAQILRLQNQRDARVKERIRKAQEDTEQFVNLHRQAPDVYALARYVREHDSLPAASPRRAALARAIAGDADYICDAVEAWIADCSLPVEIGVDYDYQLQENALYIDLDLPEIEDLPATTPGQLQSGKLTEKSKTQRQLREEYAGVVYGVALLLAANLFAISPAIERILLSGYTQRRDSLGDMANVYLFSVRLNRAAFEGVKLADEDAEAFFHTFENRCIVTSGGLFKEIVPYDTL